MAILTENNQEWLEYNGLTITIDGIKHKITVRSYEAIYPYAHTTLYVDASQVNKSTKSYQDVKRHLGDDWSTDVLMSECELDVLRQCRLLAADARLKAQLGDGMHYDSEGFYIGRIANGQWVNERKLGHQLA